MSADRQLHTAAAYVIGKSCIRTLPSILRREDASPCSVKIDLFSVSLV